MARGFYESGKNDPARIKEFLFRRYGAAYHEIIQMPFIEFVRFWRVAQEEKVREENYLAWVAIYPHMNKENYISFEDFNARATGSNVDTRSDAEILAEVAEIRNEMERIKNG